MKRGKKPKSLENTIKFKKLEKLIKSSAKDDLEDYETTVFEGRTLGKIQKYLKSIKKSANIPQLVCIYYHFVDELNNTKCFM